MIQSESSSSSRGSTDGMEADSYSIFMDSSFSQHGEVLTGPCTTRKQQGYRGKKSSEFRRNNVIPTTYRRNKSSEIIPQNFFFPRKSLGIFRRNSEETYFRGNSEDHLFVGKLLGIYRGRTSSGYLLGVLDRSMRFWTASTLVLFSSGTLSSDLFSLLLYCWSFNLKQQLTIGKAVTSQHAFFVSSETSLQTYELIPNGERDHVRAPGHYTNTIKRVKLRRKVLENRPSWARCEFWRNHVTICGPTNSCESAMGSLPIPDLEEPFTSLN
ncbi:hypothetical protein DY000_02032974 [Brassica cretica]|uniref:Uncharacterized protein n=1 Tax=Brassica cretica TaxID=69181 RepID=A0ABQ7DIN0_BRACR|nr:hypothetical protein DY000_02032974 [Brassica cretica]